MAERDNDKFYCNSSQCGFEEFDTVKEANEAAEETLHAMFDSDGGMIWDDDAFIEVGRILPLGRLVLSNVIPTDAEDDGSAIVYDQSATMQPLPDDLATLRAENARLRERVGYVERSLRRLLVAVSRHETARQDARDLLPETDTIWPNGYDHDALEAAQIAEDVTRDQLRRARKRAKLTLRKTQPPESPNG